MEALERRLRGELATMADGMAEDEAALRRDLDAMGDEEDEADVLMREILAEERATSATSSRCRRRVHRTPVHRGAPRRGSPS